MPTPMWIFAKVASDYGVDPDDEDAVDLFYQDTMQTLSESERRIILARLLSHDMTRSSESGDQ